MLPDPTFLTQPGAFWANVRLISEQVGYTDRRTRGVLAPRIDQIITALSMRGLETAHVLSPEGHLEEMGQALAAYFEYRAKVLNELVEPSLMNAEEARDLYEEIRQSHRGTCPLPLNKQKGEKRAPAYFTGIINMLIERAIGLHACDYSPRQLTTVAVGGFPIRTLARWVDGAFPSTHNPIAVWEVKEYYYTTTFGSRVADGVYESLLDGMELEELREHEQVNVLHYLMVDSHYTWWECGRSYLCRLIDMLHMGYVDEVLFGREVVKRLPVIASGWLDLVGEEAATEASPGVQ